MRRKILIAFMALSAYSAYAATLQFGWLGSLTCSAERCQSMIADIRFNEQGDGFVLADYGTLAATDDNAFLGQHFGGADYGMGTSYNKNMLLSKFDLEGNLLWQIHSIDGDYQSGCFCPTSDGGVILVARFRLSFRNKVVGQEAEQCHIVDAAGASFVTTATYNDALYANTVVLRINAQGEILSARVLDAGVQAANPLTVRAVVTDEEDCVYLAGSTTEQHAVLYKLNKRLEEINQLVMFGNTLDDRWNGLLYKAGKLYLGGNAKNDAATELIYGEKVTYISELNFINACVDTNLRCEYLAATPILRHNDKQNYLFYQMQWSGDQQTYYISGGFMGGLMVGDRYIHAGGELNSTMNDGYTIQIDSETGTLRNAVITGNTTLNLNQGVIERGDSLYIVGYQFGSVWMKRYDKQLNYQDERLIATGGGMSALVAVASYNDMFCVGLRSQRGQDFSIMGQTVNEDVLWYSTIAAGSFADTSDGLEHLRQQPSAQKIVRDGQVLIRRGEDVYTILGNKIL
ncbi:MAG: hypothetical protein NC038_03630 [Paludibacter sp.]|nr:hypothetical protein [Bacteroidales bacterium]MCM1069170.1 hypothetical protein [Prevotella sp.]MCM1354075.1 hypothetical protein [Bacteroides sp.]MCM1442952.1 hypothetical protein [Muribaculum sp.]MCM1481725.1 hypothetical protein [Paludibacter sp.]